MIAGVLTAAAGVLLSGGKSDVPEAAAGSMPEASSVEVFPLFNDYFVLVDPFAPTPRPKREGPSLAVRGLQTSAAYLRRSRQRARKVPRTTEFLLAVDALMPSFEALGTAISAAAVKDVLGNANKLRKNGAPRSALQDLVSRDVRDGNHGHPDSSAQALLWLTRILKFTATFFEMLRESPNRSLNECAVAAYERELGKYHNVVMRSLAFALMQIIPDRQSMVSCFEVDGFENLSPFLLEWIKAVRPVLERFDAFYRDHVPPTPEPFVVGTTSFY
ncbi:hypothetical protein CTAYLR_002575 [Chrysophaeum taylorii]|uniref:Glycolipid transfer protein domain-containing protein n=1 Tax=Chrysophaeum taylorii TaxID=2483200 RepID=A0AAD7XKG1_9STRA|nr:hypothetical protein CTAYLR_002575 [Chrysophaeum taylorii]